MSLIKNKIWKEHISSGRELKFEGDGARRKSEWGKKVEKFAGPGKS